MTVSFILIEKAWNDVTFTFTFLKSADGVHGFAGRVDDRPTAHSINKPCFHVAIVFKVLLEIPLLDPNIPQPLVLFTVTYN